LTLSLPPAYADLKVSKALAAAIKDARNKAHIPRGKLATQISVKETVLADYEMAKS